MSRITLGNRLWLLAVLLWTGCASGPGTASRPDPAGDAAFQRLAAEYIEGYLAWRPQTGTALGLHQYDGKITDFSRPSLAAELARLKSFDERLGRLATNTLTPAAFYDYRILRGSIQREIFGFEQMQIYSLNPMTYAGALDVNIYIKRDFAPLPDRVRSLTAILNRAPDIVAAAQANLAESLPRPQVETAIEQAEGAIDFLGKDLVEAVESGKDDRLLAAFNVANQQAIEAMRGYVKYLKEAKLPKANAPFALGPEKYSEMLRCGEMITSPPDQLLAIGLRELRSKQQVFAASAAEISPGQAPAEVFRAIQKDHPAAPALIPDTTRDLEVIRRFVVDRGIITIPSRVRARVMETPQYLRATSFASMDTPGPFETKATEAYYYVTPPEPAWPARQQEEWLTAFNYYTTDIVSIHEAYPGHYVQYLCLNASRATRLEKMFVSYAFSEGWAHYSEQMMVDQGFAGPAPDPVRAAKYRLAQTDEALLRVCRLCVSIQMHCQGMTVEAATRFFQENCYYEEKAARSEAMRGTYDPEYLYYTLGKLQILKLREDYRRQEGMNFSLRRFHDEMLRHGAPPIRLLREVLLQDPALWDQVL
jgi:uncharacterized protein (DUF885 family)